MNITVSVYRAAQLRCAARYTEKLNALFRNHILRPDISDNKHWVMQRHIWVVQRDGSHPSQLTVDPTYRDEFPRWSADGQHMLFVRTDANNTMSLWWLRSDGTQPVQLIDQIGPVAEPAAAPWFGYYEYIDWASVVNWWTGP